MTMISLNGIQLKRRWLAKKHDDFLIWTCWNSSLVITILEVCLQFIQVQFKNGLFSNHFWNTGFKDFHSKVYLRLDSLKILKVRISKKISDHFFTRHWRTALSVSCPCLVFVRIFREIVFVVCQSGWTKTRQSCPDFHCPISGFYIFKTHPKTKFCYFSSIFTFFEKFLKDCQSFIIGYQLEKKFWKFFQYILCQKYQNSDGSILKA